MGLTYQSTGFASLKEMFQVKTESPEDIVIALSGNPNTGKSTLFNSLTGLKQHTGNWPGKTVTIARGSYCYRNRSVVVVDLPGTYSLFANSEEEEIARNFICFSQPDATVIVLDSTCLERNLILVLQILEITRKAVICINFFDEAARKKIKVDLLKLEERLGVPVLGTNARDGVGLDKLKEAIYRIAVEKNAASPLKINYSDQIEKAVAYLEPAIKKKVDEKLNARWAALRLLDGDKTFLEDIRHYLNFDLVHNSSFNTLLQQVTVNTEDDKTRYQIVASIVKLAEELYAETVVCEAGQHNSFDRKMDNILTSRIWGIPIMLTLLGLVFWITIKGANIPSEMLASGFNYLEGGLTALFISRGAPDWLHGILVLGIFKTVAWVVSVMLPPMAIFFPLFTLLEDSGYLPRVAFNLDHFFKKACAHGKQVLTMCMGFGCNAAGIISCRIIDSPREKLIAVITNTFVPCNGRFPILIALSSLFIAYQAGPFRNVVAALSILLVIMTGIVLTLIISKILSKTILKGMSSAFALELPPYRKPQVGRIMIRSIFDRTLFVLARAVLVAAPAGLLIWLMANVFIGETSILNCCAGFLDSFARLIGLDGFILMAFILGLPANEIVIPILIMSYMSQGELMEFENLEAMRKLFVDHGWTLLTAICTMLFALNHWPCGTTLFTIRRETQSLKWTLQSILIPTITGIIVCFIVAQTARLLGLS